VPTLTFSEIAEMTGGTLVQGGPVVAESVVIDSREAKPDSVFFAIRGERFDGHQFLPEALAVARGAVVSRVPEGIAAEKGIVRVGDTTAALQRLSQSIRERFRFLLIAVTGSAGKTTTKEMIAALVATERRTDKSRGNLNNEIGAPLSIDNISDGVEVVVSEIAMSHKGEIARIAGWLRPDVGVYTNVAPVHIEFFGTIEKIAEAKRELLENLAAGGRVVLNADNEHVVRIAQGFEGRKVTYGVERDAQYRATRIRERGLLGTRFALEAEGEAREFDLALPGRHNLENLLAAIATARAVGISWEGIERGVGEVNPAYHRGVIVPWRGATIYDDTYNSNPFALGRALELMAQAETGGRRIAVIGDMLELGEREIEFHRQAGAAVPKAIDVLIGVGDRAKALLEGAREAGFPSRLTFHLADAESAGAFLEGFIEPGDLVLIKGSRGIGLDRAIAMLQTAHREALT
jgi:UDP-N-acetylmuramoyl-tripeptide--D-alanyl-D-alanine ligase